MKSMREFVLASSLPEAKREMLLSDAVILNPKWDSDFTVDHISPAACTVLLLAIGRGGGTQTSIRCKRLIHLLEAYLSVIGRRLDFDGEQFSSTDVLFGFAGALYSERFLYATAYERYKWVFAWRRACVSLCPALHFEMRKPSTVEAIPQHRAAAAEFEKLELDSVQVDLWRGWPIPNTNGLVIWPDLRGLYLHYGKEFTEAYALALAGYLAARRGGMVKMAKPFADFLVETARVGGKKSLTVASELRQILTHFLIGQCRICAEKETQFSTLCGEWGQFTNFAAFHLFTGEHFAKLEVDEVPRLPGQHSDRSNTHRRTNAAGQVYIAKLLTDIPLHLSDEDAMELVHFKIAKHLDLIETWATSEVDRMWATFNRREELATTGTAKAVLLRHPWDGRTALIDRDNPSWEANACATFKAAGFRMRSEGRQRMLYPRRLGRLAVDVLALPASGTLAPHMTLLVIEHPELTPSFFENLRLYDDRGQVASLNQNDTGWILDGAKFRRGAGNAEQKILLSDRSAKIVAQVIELTRPLRDYMKKNGDPDWQLLFLSCGKGFGKPRRYRISSDTTHPKVRARLKNALMESSGVPEAEASALAERFSLTTVRASTAIAAYIREPDVQRLAKMLGHKKLDIKLLQRYLPPPLLKFFEERWVRLFQCGILVEALKDSKYLLPSVGFKSMQELNEFVSRHALKWSTRSEPSAPTRSPALESVVLTVSEEILTLLVSLHDAVITSPRPVKAVARKWKDYAQRLFAYIEESVPPRRDMQEMLYVARQRASRSLIADEVIYA